MGAVSMEGFAPRTVDKVERLLDLMEEMGPAALWKLQSRHVQGARDAC